MTDYYPLISKAVTGLEKNTGETRRALYERARTALVGQLRGLTPPLTESEITRERLGLEEAIRKVEAEAARRPRSETPRPEPPRPEPPRPETSRPDGRANLAETAAPNGADKPEEDMQPPPVRPVPGAPRRAEAPPPGNGKLRPEPSLSGEDSLPRGSGRNRLASERPPLTDTGLKGFRDVVAEAETLGEATAQASKSARQAYAAVPTDIPELDRIEPRVEPPGLRNPSRVGPTVRAPAEPPGRPAPEASMRPIEPPSPRGPDARPAPPRAAGFRRGPVEPMDESSGRSLKAVISAVVAVLVIVAVAAALYLMRGTIRSFLARTPAAPTQQDSAPSRPKISDRVGQSGQQNPASDQTATSQGPTAAVAQRVVLYEEDPADPQGKRYVGSVIWRTETVSPGPGQPPEVAVRADLEIPERHITMTLSVRRNTDQALPASHTIEIMFNLPADFPFGGISNVPGILMKQAEQTRGAPLAGLAVKVTSGFFLVGLSAAETERQRNLELLKERSWFDIPIVYNNGRRAILAIEKGTPGERAFADAFAAWGE